MAEEGLVSGAALIDKRCCWVLCSGWCCCGRRRSDGGAEMGAGADTSRGRTAELLRGAASGRGVAPSCNTVLPPGRVIAKERRVLVCCSFCCRKRSV